MTPIKTRLQIELAKATVLRRDDLVVKSGGQGVDYHLLYLEWKSTNCLLNEEAAAQPSMYWSLYTV